MRKNEKGCLIVLSGPSGAGKSTVISRLMGLRGDIAFSVSATTRAMRPGEEEGVSYYYVSRDRFQEMVAGNELLEHAKYVGNCYGTPKAPILRHMEAGKTVILDIEVQGARQVKAAMPGAVTVFCIPPSFAELERRLRGRGTDSEEKIRGRLQTAVGEIGCACEYDFIIINDDPDLAARELDAIITAEKCRSANRRDCFIK